HRNYPNPFNPTTIISYDLPEAVRVELVIYDILGQHIITMKTGRQEAGTYRARWNGTNDLGLPVSTGIYFYQLNAGENSANKKMIFMK
ncbi:MAG: T9SS type A sorting domain-containing protein, partial [Bacteroidetes bacterium]|nr:T9SS type A sorting domain-containing protein [Bacteroidota bacterium]